MAENPHQLKAILENVRNDAQKALALLSPETRSLSWTCRGCGYVKHFTRPVPEEVAGRCPKCPGEAFRAS
jgi:rubrerythrin